jgi:cell shape-determining protein MreC
MENEKRAQLEAQHQKKLESLREEVVRLTSLLEHASGSKSGEPTFTT